MKTLDEIKEEYAKDKGWESYFVFILETGAFTHDNAINDVAKLYAIEYAKEALKNASENADTIEVDNGYGLIDVVDKQSILSESNLPKH